MSLLRDLCDLLGTLERVLTVYAMGREELAQVMYADETRRRSDCMIEPTGGI